MTNHQKEFWIIGKNCNSRSLKVRKNGALPIVDTLPALSMPPHPATHSWNECALYATKCIKALEQIPHRVTNGILGKTTALALKWDPLDTKENIPKQITIRKIMISSV